MKERYKAPGGDVSRLLEQPVPDRVSGSSPDLTVAAGFGMLLRDSQHRGSLDATQCWTSRAAARGQDADGYRADFISLVERCRRQAAGGERSRDSR